jgi:hypothetical protein
VHFIGLGMARRGDAGDETAGGGLGFENHRFRLEWEGRCQGFTSGDEGERPRQCLDSLWRRRPGARSVAAAACVHDSGGSWRLGVTEGKVGLGCLGRRSAGWPRPSWVLKSCEPALLPKKKEIRSGL